MEPSIYFSLVLLVLLVAVILFAILISILNKIRKELSGINNKLEESTTKGVFKAKIHGVIITNKPNIMEKKTEETSNMEIEKPALSAASPADSGSSGTTTQTVDIDISGTVDDKSNDGSGPGSGPK